jgi:hypothetical protein
MRAHKHTKQQQQQQQQRSLVNTFIRWRVFLAVVPRDAVVVQTLAQAVRLAAVNSNN